jgi:protease-4
MRRHPFLMGILLLLVIGFMSFVLILGLAYWTGGGSLLTVRDKVGVVFVKGIISEPKSVVELLKKYGEDSNVRAVVVRIDSPGGGVAASQEIYDALGAVKKKKKVVASMGSVAASAGYYVACAADKIVANPGSVTGSIGALMHFSNLEDLLKKIGLKSSVIKSGKFKDIGSPVREMTAEEQHLIQGVIDDIYDQFLTTVSQTRKIPKEKLRPIADGRIFTGRQALKLGLVDELGDMEHSIDLAAKLSGMKGRPDVLYPKEKGLTIWKMIADEMVSALISRLKEETAGYN